MDNRWKFLYYDITELWGHGRKAWARKGKTCTSGVGVHQANPVCNPNPLRGAKRSSEAREPAVEKSRYRLYHTRTVNRHRWMRRES